MTNLRAILATAALAVVPALAFAQAPAAASANPVSDALRQQTTRSARIIPAAFETFPADKFNYRPTPAQMSVAMIALHLIEANDGLCGMTASEKAPERAKLDTTATKDALIAQLKASFAFCTSAFAKLEDSKMGDQVPGFGGRPTGRANLVMINVADWADHYSQLANYLRLNNLLPPTAQPRPNP
jgi:DinB superfamily